MDLDEGSRPSTRRLVELIEEKPDTVAVSCGFCLAMFEDALKGLEEAPSVRIRDWLELLRDAVEGQPSS